MRTKLLLLMGFFLLTSSMVGQQIGTVYSGGHSIALLKSNDKFACVYSDVDSHILFPKKAFVFPNKDTIYKLMIAGFSNENNHQVYVKVNEITIIRFEYKRIQGEMMIKINHNNLISNTIGRSAFMSKTQVDELFGKTSSRKI